MFIYKIPQVDILKSFVTNYPARVTVGQAAQDWHEKAGGVTLVINGDGWPSRGGNSNSIWYSNGSARNSTQMEWNPWLNFDRTNQFSFGWKHDTHWNCYNAVSGTRFMVENGAINPRFQETGELNARTGVGITGNNELVIIVCDGWDAHKDALDPAGLTLTQLGEIAIDQGCHTFVDFDGGGSTTLAVNGQVVNEPNDDGVEGQRAVVNHLCLQLSKLDNVPTVPEDPPTPDPEPEPTEDPVVYGMVVTESGKIYESHDWNQQ